MPGSFSGDGGDGLTPPQQSGLPGNLPTGASGFPGLNIPESPPVLANNIYAPYFDPFFAYNPNDPLLLPAGWITPPGHGLVRFDWKVSPLSLETTIGVDCA